jgi:hypothetical protein
MPRASSKYFFFRIKRRIEGKETGGKGNKEKEREKLRRRRRTMRKKGRRDFFGISVLGKFGSDT